MLCLFDCSSQTSNQESLRPQKSYGGTSMQTTKIELQNSNYNRSLNLREASFDLVMHILWNVSFATYLYVNLIWLWTAITCHEPTLNWIQNCGSAQLYPNIIWALCLYWFYIYLAQLQQYYSKSHHSASSVVLHNLIICALCWSGRPHPSWFHVKHQCPCSRLFIYHYSLNHSYQLSVQNHCLWCDFRQLHWTLFLRVGTTLTFRWICMILFLITLM